MKILFVTLNGIKDAAFGGAKASIRNFEVLKTFGKVDVYHIKKRNTAKSIVSILEGYYPPVLRLDEQEILKRLATQKYDFVFFDHSALGKIVAEVSTIVPTILFYHNCESDYINVRFKKNSIQKKLYQWSVDKNEGIATKAATYRIVFTQRDKERIEDKYGITVNAVIPIGIADKYDGKKFRHENYCLLFGPVGTANLEGVKWFASEVSPYLKCKTIIAGKGFDEYKSELENDKVEVYGFIENISEIYGEATCVAIPLFSGGGMKIKTAEALMFGKFIFGTDEAFVGYDFDERRIGGRCNTAQEFISEINEHVDESISNFNLYAREQYIINYSVESAVSKFSDVIKQIK